MGNLKWLLIVIGIIIGANVLVWASLISLMAFLGIPGLMIWIGLMITGIIPVIGFVIDHAAKQHRKELGVSHARRI